ncbi:hypothetical protein JS528_04215 [Bifidobacterium sp. MA2]|uniref:Uncharacterized protein n=1 Tax=Bifidobacterium santillanense TaxID=2809028 RepID=A0ABS5UP08_9BIFI|nr:hypothetical protein [Bifidobacterium santillanense]MBT1172573.1 hypothetical protein [Bifidobacterium santillanense]
MNESHANRGMRLLALIASVGLLCAPAACGTGTSASDSPGQAQGSGGSVSRVTLYASVDQLAEDSDLIIAGQVTDTTTARDIDDSADLTLATVTVLETLKGETPDANEAIVHQTGSREQHTPNTLYTPNTLLSRGDVVLLFLVHSGLGGNLAEQYYITGAGAGMYRMTDAESPLSIDDMDNVSFHRVNTDSGDDLPDVLSVEELRNGIG